MGPVRLDVLLLLPPLPRHVAHAPADHGVVLLGSRTGPLFPVFPPFFPRFVPISPPFFGQTGVWPTFAASHSDVFGTRPELYSRIQAADNMYVNFISMLGGPATTAITLAFGNIHAAQPIAGVLATLSMLVVFTIPETLKPERRKPLEWGKLLGRANPLSNLMLLMNKGSGLRRLSISASLQ